MTDPQLAQFNVARLKSPLTDPCMRDFVARLDEINAVADGSPGFVWRWRHTLAQPLSAGGWPDWVARTRLMCTLSVWTDIAALRDFVYQSAHADLLRARRAWFAPIAGTQIVLWWVPAGARPSLAQGKRRLARLRARGPSPLAFTLTNPVAEDAV